MFPLRGPNRIFGLNSCNVDILRGITKRHEATTASTFDPRGRQPVNLPTTPKHFARTVGGVCSVVFVQENHVVSGGVDVDLLQEKPELPDNEDILLVPLGQRDTAIVAEVRDWVVFSLSLRVRRTRREEIAPGASLAK